MKIALIYDRVYPWVNGGGEKTLWDIARELKAIGHEVHYFGTKLWEGADRIEKEGIVLHGVCDASEFYTGDGRRTFAQPLQFGLGLFRALWREREVRFDLINCTVFPYFSVLAVWLFRIVSRSRVPWLLSWLEVWGRDYWRGYLHSWWKGLVGFSIEWLCARCCGEHVVISTLHARRLHSLLGVATDKIHVVPRGTHLNLLPAVAGKQPQRVIYAGRIAAYKNLGTLLRAWPSVLEACPAATLSIIGSGPAQSEVEDLVRTLDLGSSVQIFPPKSTWKEIIEEIAAAEIFVQPSIREGQSVTAIEAMAVGTAVIASRHAESAVSDFVVDRENGLLITEWDDPEAWSRALIGLLDDAPLRSKLAIAGRQTAQRYDWTTAVIPQLDALHRAVATESKRPQSNKAYFRACNMLPPILLGDGRQTEK